MTQEQKVRTREGVWFIKRYGAWFRPNAQGYCNELMGAGAFSEKHAKSYLGVEGIQIFPVDHPLIQSELSSLYTECKGFWDAVLSPESRGAEEQRRKDAEGQEPAYYIDHRGTFGNGSPPFAVKTLAQCAFVDTAEPVYTHPANVTALEARVKVLEVYYQALEVSYRHGILNMTEEQFDRLDKARAALTREGGVP